MTQLLLRAPAPRLQQGAQVASIHAAASVEIAGTRAAGARQQAARIAAADFAISVEVGGAGRHHLRLQCAAIDDGRRAEAAIDSMAA